MSVEVVTTVENVTTGLDLEELSTETIWVNKDEGDPSTTLVEFSTESINNTSISIVDKQQSQSESDDALFEAFVVIEIVMTALELILSVLAASKVARWRRNYRNQMLMQLSLVRLLKRVHNYMEFWNHNKTMQPVEVSTVLISIQIYIDFVIVILVCFFIKHMYDSLIVVLVKINQNQLVKVITCSWLVPLPISVIGTTLIYTDLVTYKSAYIFICAVFRWPLILVGTLVYIIIVIRVLFDKIRQFARSLTIITFLLCLVINVHLFCKDVIWLWCIESFPTVLASYLLGFIMNVLILCLYIVLITLQMKRKTQSCGDNLNYSEYVTKC